jgi:hypothetical protein
MLNITNETGWVLVDDNFVQLTDNGQDGEFRVRIIMGEGVWGSKRSSTFREDMVLFFKDTAESMLEGWDPVIHPQWEFLGKGDPKLLAFVRECIIES